MPEAIVVDQTNFANGSGESVSYDTSTQSTAFAAGTRNVRVKTTTDAWVEVGDNPTATTASFHVTSGSTEYFSARASQKVAILKVASAGTAYVRAVK